MNLPRALLWMPGSAGIPGGHVAQLEQTARALEHLGCEVIVSFDRSPTFPELDIVHGFGLNAKEAAMCRERGLTLVASTIYWALDYRYGGLSAAGRLRPLLGRLTRAARFALASSRGQADFVKECMLEIHHEIDQIAMLSAADLLLPNAAGEAQSLYDDLDVHTPSRVIPNGVDPARFSPGEGNFADRGIVLMVGRIEPHKNQLGLLEALRGSGRRVVLAGFPHPDHAQYVDRCRKAAAGWADVVVGPTIDTLVDYYRSARVHILPSWFETTGLVSLEAGLCGCNLVSTSRGYAEEYLGDLAWYCDPAKPDSIRAAVDQAWIGPPRPALRERILGSYTWDHVARATLAAYQEAIARHARGEATP